MDTLAQALEDDAAFDALEGGDDARCCTRLLTAARAS